jgi:hypothetical protein
VAGYDKQVATTWSLAIAALGQDSPAAGLLRLGAYCAAEDIPLDELLRPGVNIAESGAAVIPLLAPLLDDELARDNAVAGLRRYSLISAPRDGRVSVHRLVQAITLHLLPAQDRAAWRRAAAALIEATIPPDPQDPGSWPVFAAMLPHARAVLDPASGGMFAMAQYLGHNGRYAVARDLGQQVCEARQASSGADHPDTLLARADLAFWIGQTEDPASARDQFAALVPVNARVLGAEHPETLAARSNLARWTGGAGDPATARDQFVELLSTCCRSTSGSWVPSTGRRIAYAATWPAGPSGRRRLAIRLEALAGDFVEDGGGGAGGVEGAGGAGDGDADGDVAELAPGGGQAGGLVADQEQGGLGEVVVEDVRLAVLVGGGQGDGVAG